MWLFMVGVFLSAVEERCGEHRGEVVMRAREASALAALREVAQTLTLRFRRASGRAPRAAERGDT